jgi:hypothetical protein
MRLQIILTGKPEQSILLNRLESLAPGVAMPELGRASVHRESADLLRQWIEEMPARLRGLGLAYEWWFRLNG